MKKRPTSVTVIAWVLIVINAFSLLGVTMTLDNPEVVKVMAQSPIPVQVQHVMTYVELSVSILCAIFMLQGANWARLLYILCTGIGLLVPLATSPSKVMLIPALLVYGVIVFFLLRPNVSAYFKQ